jgi:ubiquinone/menaquinone biosynthesis C-methylase UbiE
MGYDEKLWKRYTDENMEKIQDDQSKFIYFLSVALGAKRICEAGCNIGNNLSHFPRNCDVYGFDMSDYALEKARKRYPSFKFEVGNMNVIPFDDSFFDLVFTRGVLIHVPSTEIDVGLKELTRVSKKWIMNLEYFGKDGEMIKWSRGDDLLWYRNMKERWSKFDVEIVCDADIPQEIDPGRVRLTLVRKNV